MLFLFQSKKQTVSYFFQQSYVKIGHVTITTIPSKIVTRDEHVILTNISVDERLGSLFTKTRLNIVLRISNVISENAHVLE